MKVAFIFGTRPEITKSLGVAKVLSHKYHVPVIGVATGQQTTIVDETLKDFDVGSAISIVWIGDKKLSRYDPDWERKFKNRFLTLQKKEDVALFVGTGDTNSVALAAELSKKHSVPFLHLEAGIRHIGVTKNLEPEERNRRFISPIASMHFCPTAKEKSNLLVEKIKPNNVKVTGNLSEVSISEIWRLKRIRTVLGKAVFDHLTLLNNDRLCVCTFHRSTSLLNMNALIDSFCELVGYFPQVKFIICRRPDTRWDRFYTHVSRANNVSCIPAPPPLMFQDILCLSDLILTDSAGVQQEGLLLNKPVVALRQNIELDEGHPLLYVESPPFYTLCKTFWNSLRVSNHLVDTDISFICQNGAQIMERNARLIKRLFLS